MTRGGRTKLREGPERKCIVTGAVRPKAGLIRFVVGPDDAVVPDILGKLPGRGIWVSAERAALEEAVSKRLFARAARQALAASPDLPAMVEAALARRCIDGISLARKAGAAVAGFEKVKDWLVKDEAKVLVQASDGSGRGKDKLRTPEGGRFVGCLTASELGLAFGREHVIHAALAAGGLTTRIVEDAARLSGVRGDGGGIATRKDE